MKSVFPDHPVATTGLPRKHGLGHHQAKPSPRCSDRTMSAQAVNAVTVPRWQGSRVDPDVRRLSHLAHAGEVGGRVFGMTDFQDKNSVGPVAERTSEGCDGSERILADERGREG